MPHTPEEFESAQVEEQAVDPSTSLLQEVLKGRAPLERISDPERRARMERTQAAMESVAVPLHELHLLDHEAQLEVVDRVLNDVFNTDEAAQTTISKIAVARDKHDEKTIKTLTAEQKERYTVIRRDIATALGVEIEDTALEDEQYREKLLEKVSGLSDASEEDIMRRLGFLKTDEKTGNDYFNFPENNFPPHIVTKWKNYEETIKQHVGASMRFNRAIDDNSDEIEQLDALRRYAHNNLSKSVQEFLKLEDWDFERVRKFITKLVEHRFPTVETMESKVTSEAVVSRLKAIRALGTITFFNHVEEEEEEER